MSTPGKLTFNGGVHPPDYKEFSSQCAIKSIPVPKQLAIMLSQHIGAICKPVVNKRDHIAAGQLIGNAEAFVSAPVHSPVNGTVKDIALQSHPVLGRAEAIIIESDEDNPPKQPCPDKFSTDFDPSRFLPEQIFDAVRKAGIVGMGGAGFPTSVKIKLNPESPINTIIINGCECEPFITCDYRIMLEWTVQILTGVSLIGRALNCGNIYIAVEDNKPDAVAAFEQAIRKMPSASSMKVVAVKTKYPQGGERQLIKSIINKDVPTGGIPPMINVLVANVATAAAIAEAVLLDNPLTHRVVTVSGGGIKNPGNFYAPIGTSASHLIELAGGLNDNAVKIILGGPMMGFSIADLSTPLTKTGGAITVLTDKDIVKRKETPCIRCGRCVEACPVNLNPTRIAHAVKHNLLDAAQEYYMSACIECGCCSYICPADIELSGFIKTGKILVARQKKLMPK
ncbi:MAG: electron transport complex subunit RsxC [Planctomycetes bacterium HGW-Planctomycetes-1]|nr:MAG: electron transport complex subunit RsxC [Planctomycetes bacterium HGW-Planctomycetes-1]